jgi:dihydrofolate synthase/folylpolyglutamate synthase
MNELLSYLYKLERRGIKVGLEYTEQFLDYIGNPHKQFQIIHIAGTNGKGSTCAFIASILRTAGYKVGLYTSPHLIRFNERIRVDGIPISDDEIKLFVKTYRNTIDENFLTFFETTTAMAFWYFNKVSVDVGVIETGLGGRLDSTNVVSPKITTILPIDFDHRHILGQTLEKISVEKGGIIKPGVPVVVAPQHKEVSQVLKTIANQKHSQCEFINSPKILEMNHHSMNTMFEWKRVKYTIPFLGEHQAINAVTAIQTVRTFDNTIPFKILQLGIAKTIWWGRMQKLDSNIPVFYDVAHNSSGLNVVLKTLNSLFPDNPRGIIALKGDKELDLIAHEIRGKFSELFTFNSTHGELYSPQVLCETLTQFEIPCIHGINVKHIISMLLQSKSPETPLLIFGSHYIAKDVFESFDFPFDSGII